MPAEPRSGESQNPPFLFVIPAEPRQRRGPESIARANRYGFRAGANTSPFSSSFRPSRGSGESRNP